MLLFLKSNKPETHVFSLLVNKLKTFSVVKTHAVYNKFDIFYYLGQDEHEMKIAVVKLNDIRAGYLETK